MNPASVTTYPACRFCYCQDHKTDEHLALSYATVLSHGSADGSRVEQVLAEYEHRFTGFLTIWCTRCHRLSINVYPALCDLARVEARRGQVSEYTRDVVVTAYMSHVCSLFDEL